MELTNQNRLQNDLYCVGWGVKLYSLTDSSQTRSAASFLIGWRRGSVIRTLVFGWRTFFALWLIYG